MLHFTSLTILGSRQHQRSPTSITKSITSPPKKPQAPTHLQGSSRALWVWSILSCARSMLECAQTGEHPPSNETEVRGPHLTCSDIQLYPILYDPMDYSPPDSSVHGIFQARILEWIAMPFSRDLGLIPGLGRSPEEGNGNPLQYFFLENPVDRGAWWATAHGVTKSRTPLSN